MHLLKRKVNDSPVKQPFNPGDKLHFVTIWRYTHSLVVEYPPGPKQIAGELYSNKIVFKPLPEGNLIINALHKRIYWL